MPLYELEVIHTIRYKRTVRAKDESDAREKADQLWMEYMTVGVDYIDDEQAEVMVFPHYRRRKDSSPPASDGGERTGDA